MKKEDFIAMSEEEAIAYLIKQSDVPSYNLEELSSRIIKAIFCAYDGAWIDGAHHKMEVIDEMVKELLGGADSREFELFVEHYETPRGPDNSPITSDDDPNYISGNFSQPEWGEGMI